MSKPLVLGIAGITISLVMLALGYVAGTRPDTAPQTPQVALEQSLSRGEVEGIVREYLLANPELLSQMQAALEDQEREFQRLAQVETIESAADDIFNASYDGIVGNSDGDVTIVEFFDYNCGFCKRAMEDMDAMVAADPQLRFVLKEFPILGPDSQNAHIVSMAFRALAPEQYGDFHRDLMSGSRATEETAIAAALAHGADEEALRAEMENPALAQAIATTYDLAGRLSITGTPSYVIGTEIVFGALGQAVLREKVEQVRATN